MQQLTLKRRLNPDADLVLREPVPQQAKQSDFSPENYLDSNQEVKVLKEDGTLLLWIIPNVFALDTCLATYEHLRKVSGDPTSRGEVTGGQHEMRRRSDGSVSNIRASSPEQIAKYKAMGSKADFLGYMDPSGRFPYCRQTAWTAAHPEILKGCWPIINGANDVFKELLPEQYQAQFLYVSEHGDFVLGNTPFTTMTVNKNLPTTYHRDEGDYRPGFGVMLTLGNFKGGEIVFPAFGVAVDYQPGSLVFGDVHETHGNLDNIEGERVAVVLYAREGITECGSADDEEAKQVGKMSIHTRED